jgi:hypothetical protein
MPPTLNGVGGDVVRTELREETLHARAARATVKPQSLQHNHDMSSIFGLFFAKMSSGDLEFTTGSLAGEFWDSKNT